MAKRTQLSYGDSDDYRLPEADAADANSAIERSGEQPWTPSITREVLDKVQRVVTELPGIVSAQASAAGVMAAFRAADQGIVTPTPAQVAGGGGGIGLVNGTGGGVGGALGQFAGSLGAAQSILSNAVSFASNVNTPGTARVGDALSVWQGMQSEGLQQQTTWNQMAGTARGITQWAQQHGWRAQVQNVKHWVEGLFSGSGPSSHGSKPAQGS